MKLFILLVSTFIIQKCVAPPVTKQKKEEIENEIEEKEELPTDVEYRRYLEEVIFALESDPEFRNKLEKANETDIRNGKIADELEYVNHKVRTKLDELKRAELERLRHLAIREYELKNDLDPSHMKINEHLDHTNPHTFEINDLKKLIAKTTKDLDEADKRRREEFKHYEMNKKFEQEEKMRKLSNEEKQQFENDLQNLEKKHKDHEPLHHPGSKKQLEEVWKKQDHMEYQQFDPRTFFFLHDLDGNGFWDQNELKSLFLKELDKLYANGHPEDDLVERAEELERMREHVIREADLNKDGLISYEEFLIESKKAEFEKDPGWEPLDEQQLYSEQEYEEYKRQKAKEIEKAISQRMLQENHPAGQLQTGHQQFLSHPNDIHRDYTQQQPQHQVPMQQQQQYPQQGQYMNQISPQHGQYNQLPPQQGPYVNQPLAQSVQYNQIPPQKDQFSNQMPHQQQQKLHTSQQVLPSNNINQVLPQQNYPPPNQQIPLQHQFQQPPAQNPNQIHHEQFNLPIGQQQNQQHSEINNVNQAPLHVQQKQDPASTAYLLNKHPPVATGQGQQNTQNQIPQQTHEQISSLNNAQVH